MRKILAERPEDFSQTATAFIKTSAQAATRRLVAGLAFGFVAPVLIAGIWVSLQVTQAVNKQVATNVADATAFAERSTYADWNIYSGLERSPSDVSHSFTAYYQLFSFLTERTPSNWDSTPVMETGPKTAKSPDGSESATVNGAEVVVSTSTGKTTRLPTSSAATSLSWSPDSRWIAVSTSAGADIVSVDNAQVIPLRGGSGTTTTVRWVDGQHVEVDGTAGTGTWQVFDGSPVTTLDGVRYGTTVDRNFYTVNGAGRITEIDTASGRSAEVPWDVPAGASPAAMDSTSAEVVVAFNATVPFLHVIDIKDNSSRDIPIPECSPIGLSLSTDGSAAYLACISSSANETRVDLRSGIVVARPMQQQLAYGVRVLNDRVLWGGIYGGVFQSGLDLTPQDMLATQAGCNTPIRKLVGPSDGSTLFPIGDATGSFACASRIRVSGGVQVDHLIFDATDGYAVPDAVTSPDGSLIAYGLSDGRVQVFTTTEFNPVYFGQVLPDQVRAVSFSLDGKTLNVAGLGGEIVMLPIPFKTAAEGAKILSTDALARLRNAVAWGIYISTKDSSKAGK